MRKMTSDGFPRNSKQACCCTAKNYEDLKNMLEQFKAELAPYRAKLTEMGNSL